MRILAKKGVILLEQKHIDWYWEAITTAQIHALNDIHTARLFAADKSCDGCDHCKYLKRHEELVKEVSARLHDIVRSLEPGMYPKTPIPRSFSPEISVYRGFIDDVGNYIPMYQNMDHEKCKQLYIEEHGRERSYRLIKITGSYARETKAIVCFADRKAPPSEAQYETLRELMIDALGDLRFQFVYDPNHPH